MFLSSGNLVNSRLSNDHHWLRTCPWGWGNLLHPWSWDVGWDWFVHNGFLYRQLCNWFWFHGWQYCSSIDFSWWCSCFVESNLRVSFVAWIFVGMLLSSSLIFSNVSICMSPFVFFLPFKASVKSLIVLTIMSTWVKVGCVMYLCLKNTVSDICSLLVFFT